MMDNEFSFDLRKRLPPKGHVIAARITAENTDNGFQPNGGPLHNVKFPGSSQTWGYFSVYHNAKIHNYSDSHFGHVFSHCTTRDEATKFLREALQETSIDADFRTNLEYLNALLNHPDFISNKHTTTWLDSLIHESYKPPKNESEHVAICAASMLIFDYGNKQKQAIKESLKKRQYPSKDQFCLNHFGKFIYDGMEYNFKAYPFMPSQYKIVLGDNEVIVSIFPCRDGTYMISFCELKFSIQIQRNNGCIYLTINGSDCLIEFDNDPASIKSPSSGRLVRFLVDDGALVNVDTAVAEVEVMKMYSTIFSKGNGVICLKKQPGSILLPGDLVGIIDIILLMF